MRVYSKCLLRHPLMFKKSEKLLQMLFTNGTTLTLVTGA